MPARCRIDLTEREARALMSVIGTVLDHEDAVDSQREHGVDVSAAFRAERKVRHSWREKFHQQQESN